MVNTPSDLASLKTLFLLSAVAADRRAAPTQPRTSAHPSRVCVCVLLPVPNDAAGPSRSTSGCYFLHMPELVMAFSGRCQNVAGANEGRMFPLKEGPVSGPEPIL